MLKIASRKFCSCESKDGELIVAPGKVSRVAAGSDVTNMEPHITSLPQENYNIEHAELVNTVQ